MFNNCVHCSHSCEITKYNSGTLSLPHSQIKKKWLTIIFSNWTYFDYLSWFCVFNIHQVKHVLQPVVATNKVRILAISKLQLRATPRVCQFHLILYHRLKIWNSSKINQNSGVPSSSCKPATILYYMYIFVPITADAIKSYVAMF